MNAQEAPHDVDVVANQHDHEGNKDPHRDMSSHKLQFDADAIRVKTVRDASEAPKNGDDGACQTFDGLHDDRDKKANQQCHLYRRQIQLHHITHPQK